MPLRQGLLGRLRIRPRSRATSPQPAVTPLAPTTDVPPAITGTSNAAFDAAVEEFKNRLTDEERDAFCQANTGISTEQLFEHVAKLDAMDKKTKPRKAMEDVSRFLRLLNQLVGGVSIGIQASPEISSLVIGGAKLIIDMAMNFVGFFQQLTSMIKDLSDHLGHLEEFSRHKDNHLIMESAKHVYGGLLEFYHYAYRVFRDKKGQARSHLHLRSGIQAQWKPFEEVFGRINTEVQHHLRVLELSANVATYDTVVNVESRVKKELEDRERKEILRWLSTKDFDLHQESMLDKRWSGTGDWLLEHESFKDWLTGAGESRLLWCNGGAGTGKSVVCSVVVDHIQRRLAQDSQNSRLVYAYFDYQNREQGQTRAIVGSLAKHLVGSQKVLPDIVVETFRDHNARDKKPNLQTMIDFFCEVAGDLSELFLVIDALDECNDEDRELFLRSFIGHVLHNIPQARVLVTSRPEASISDYLHSLSACEIKIGGEKTREDISKYIRGQIAESETPNPVLQGGLRRTLRVKDPRVRDEIIESLEAKSGGMFLWVNFQINQILEQKNENDIREVLKELPKGLDNTYARILHQAEQKSGPLLRLFLNCLKWVTRSRKQLRLYELRDAIVKIDNFADVSSLQKQRENYTLADIMDTCRGLLVSEDKYERTRLDGWAFVRPVHFSLVEFLASNPIVARPNFIILQDPMAVEGELALVCLHHLKHTCLAEGPASTFDELRLRLAGKNLPFAWYCARYFDDHAAQAPDAPRLRQSLESLLEMDNLCLAALAQLRHMRKPNLEVDFEYFDWDVNSRTIVETSMLMNIPYIKNDSRWKELALHPNSLHQACADGNSEQVRYLLEMGLEPDEPNDSGETPFWVATFRQHLEVVKLLVQAGADVNQIWEDEKTALEAMSAIGHAPLLTFLLENGANGFEGDRTFTLALYNAVWPKRENTARILLSYGAKPTESTFFEAAEFGMADVVEAGLRFGIDPNGKTYQDAGPEKPRPGERYSKPHWKQQYRGNDTRPLYCASRWGWTDVVKVLLDHGADVNLVGGPIGTALQAAALGGRLEIVQLLLKHGARINHVVGSHGTALSAAASNGQDDVVRLLLGAGADVNIPGGYFGYSLVASAEFDETMISSGPLDSVSRLFVPSAPELTIELGKQNVTERLIVAGANIVDQGPAALSKAAEKGHKKVVDLLLAHGAQFDSTTLSEAIWTQNADIAEIAIRHGADPNRSDENGRTPLYSAVNYYKRDLVSALLKGGADPNLPALDGSWSSPTRCLHVACADGRLSLVKELLENGADPNLPGTIQAGQQCRFGGYGSHSVQGSALHAVCTTSAGGGIRKHQNTNQVEIVSLLLEHGADIDQVNEHGWTALEFTCSRMRQDHDAYNIASTLISAGADIHASSSENSGPLEAAARHGFLDIMELLLKNGVDDETHKQSALQVAAEYGHKEILKYLINAGVDVRAPKGMSKFVRENEKPIHSAAREGRCDLVKMLMEAGARLDDQGHYGTVYETTLVGIRLDNYNVRNDGFAELMSLLRSEGAEEPTQTCHYGFLCNGPQCSGPGERSFYRWLMCRDVKPGAWICGTRFECSECEDFNLCSGCNDILIAQSSAFFNQEKPSGVSSSSRSHSSDESGSNKEADRSKMQHEAHHKTKRFDTRQEPDTSIAYRKDDDVYRKADALGVEKLELGVLWTG